VIEYVAVVPDTGLSSIKHQLLFFDKVAVVQSEDDWSFREQDPSLAADLDWLENKGLVFRVAEALKKLIPFEIVRQEQKDTLRITLTDFLPEDKIEEVRDDTHLGSEKTPKEILSGIDDLVCRWEAQRLKDSAGVEAISISSPCSGISDLFGLKTAQGDVVRVLLKNIPEPSSDASLEQILQFREDPENKDKMVAFRRWARTMVARQIPEREIVEELDWLTHEYTEYMRLHKMKVNKGMVEIFVTTGAEIAEGLIKMQWGKLAGLLFSLRHRKIDLLEAELKAPGREIAYVIQARKEFRE
jgi:hypothetical protein